ncbi:hypothetical protein HU675_0037295 [Bradyrhizobium septentrionale]|uniref:hypothetical protein n=1 Tax=Bradyrhizobium septentrionale TaxID=1404411 RepID=UPI0015970BCB|nr:hypothetical protein [Bradyrhizobium septentrionale]UGY23554.1 hypothetical protein HU675_0037295 [Bradyrhizobium septentrionale]
MAYEPTKIDVSGDTLVTGFKSPAASSDGKFARIALVAHSGAEVPVRMPAELIDKFLPDLMNLAAECERRRNAGTNPARVFQIKEGEVSQSSNDTVAFSFTTSMGQSYRFEMDKLGAKLIWESLGIILGLIENRSGAIERPTRQ